MKKSTQYVFLAALFAISLSIYSCKKDSAKAMPDKPTITTSNVTSITSTSAVSGGTVGDSSTTYRVYSRGILFSSVTTVPELGSPSTTMVNSNLVPTARWATYVGNMTGLTPNTTYYVRAYVSYEVLGTNTFPVLYGEVRNFRTLP